ncbi:MAG: TauD/TfdA family dioxygenase, partial [Bermanella sp.]
LPQAALKVAGIHELALIENTLPILINAQATGQTLHSINDTRQAEIQTLVERAGGVLLRGFSVPGIEDFKSFAASFGFPLLNYEFGSTPRSSVTAGVYTSTEYPAHQHIPLHNEQAYTTQWPMRIWFHCVTASETGGETPIADSRAIYDAMPAHIRERFSDGLLYVRNYGNGLDLSWQEVFNTESAAEVEEFCKKLGIEWQWKEDGELRTEQHCQGVAQHPRTGEMVWMNQAHLFHSSNLAPEIRETLIDIVGIENLPRNVFYADGTDISDEIFSEIRQVLAEKTVIFPWQDGDVLMLDNMLVAHSRTPFKGARKIVVAMAEPYVKEEK